MLAIELHFIDINIASSFLVEQVPSFFPLFYGKKWIGKFFLQLYEFYSTSNVFEKLKSEKKIWKSDWNCVLS